MMQTDAQARRQKTRKWFSRFKLFLMIAPFIVLIFIFMYYPLYGWVYAFYDFKPPRTLAQSDFVGLHWFRLLVSNSVRINQILEVLKNTFAISGLGILTSWVPIVFAILLAQMPSAKLKKGVQTLTTLPNFISWVLVYSVVFSLLSLDGFVNRVLIASGASTTAVDFMGTGDNVWITQWAYGQWKGLGWSAIMYISAISGIDTEMYEAADIDGANRFAKMRYITVPSLLPTYFVLLMLSIGNLLNNGMEQYYVFQNAWNREYIQVLDLYVYNLSTQKPPVYSISTALSMFKSVVSLVLLFGANTLSRIVRHEGII